MSAINRILIVDDDPGLLAGLVRNLGERFDIVTAESGEAALLKFQEDAPFSVILSDIRMPGMGGVKFLQRVKEIAPNAVRMVLTGFADERAAVDLINSANVFRFLDKPLPLQVLTEAIEGAVSHYRMTMAERKLAEALAPTGNRVMVPFCQRHRPPPAVPIHITPSASPQMESAVRAANPSLTLMT